MQKRKLFFCLQEPRLQTNLKVVRAWKRQGFVVFKNVLLRNFRPTSVLEEIERERERGEWIERREVVVALCS